MHSFLCTYDLSDILQLRRYMLYRIHDRLLSMDFGPMYNAFGSDCQGVIKEAKSFATSKAAS